MLLLVEKGIRGGIYHVIHHYPKANNKYKYWNINNLFGWTVPQKITCKGLKWPDNISEFDESVIKSYNEECHEGYFLEADVQYPEKLHQLHND